MRLRDPKRLSLALGTAAAVLAAAALQYFVRYQPLSALTGGLPNGLDQITLQADDVKVIGREDGQPRWRMAAQTVTFSRDRSTLQIENVQQGLLLASADHPGISLTARHGTYQAVFGSIAPGSVGGTLHLSGMVHATVLTQARPALKTEQMVWDSTQNQILCPSTVTATLPRLSVTAGNAVYTLAPNTLSTLNSQGTLHLSGTVHALFQSPHGPVVLNCPGLLWSAAQNTAQTLGPVTAQIPGSLGTVSAGSLTVDTHTGNLIGHDLQGTLRLSAEVQ